MTYILRSDKTFIVGVLKNSSICPIIATIVVLALSRADPQKDIDVNITKNKRPIVKQMNNNFFSGSLTYFSPWTSSVDSATDIRLPPLELQYSSAASKDFLRSKYL